MIHQVRLYDRSRVVTDWSCPRKRFYQYEFEGKGIVAAKQGLALFMGSCIHDGLAAIATQTQAAQAVDIDHIATIAQKTLYGSLMMDGGGQEAETYAKEQSALVEGLLRGFYKQVWPKLTAAYPTILFVEEEMTYEHGELVFMAKPDLVVQAEDGRTAYIEYKSTSSKKDSWINSWNTAVQLHSTIKAIEHTKGVKVDEVVVQGLYKGYESYGKQSSPFCYGYHRYGNPPFSRADTVYAYKAGYKRVPTWEQEGGVRSWVAEMPEEVLVEQFPCTPPIYIKEEMVTNFFHQRAFREAEIRLALEMMEVSDKEGKREILGVSFPQKFDTCTPYFGSPCQYAQLCFGEVSNPLEQGFEWREPHHLAEMEQQDVTEV